MKKKTISIMSRFTLDAIIKLEDAGILIKESYLNHDTRRVDLEKLLDYEMYNGDEPTLIFSDAVVLILLGYAENDNLLDDPYVIIEMNNYEDLDLFLEYDENN